MAHKLVQLVGALVCEDDPKVLGVCRRNSSVSLEIIFCAYKPPADVSLGLVVRQRHGTKRSAPEIFLAGPGRKHHASPSRDTPDLNE